MKSSSLKSNPLFVCTLLASLGLVGCAHSSKSATAAVAGLRPNLESMKPAEVKGPVTLRLKAEMGRTESVSYTHRSVAKAFEDQTLRHEKEEGLDFVSKAETLKVGTPDAKAVSVFTQSLSIVKKDGVGDLHDFAMPELDEKLEVTADSLGKILKSGDYPPESVFYVSPISLPENPVSVGDTWTMEASWLSLEEMIPYQLQMVSILKGFWQCGTGTTADTCAEIEISGDVGFQGPLTKAMNFKSSWKGRIFFALNAGTVLWSRTDSEERLIAERVRRDVDSCLEAVLIAPESLALQGLKGARCEKVPKAETQTAP
ncbi:MAG: hypothetical protein EOP05_02560 [Proteobacteria bacterium]|nr:MAG: hypothetical protein EOP05_02560 [Pseudomonadota bacterium]